MKYFDWDDAKNVKLRAKRGIGFEDVVFHIERGDLLDILRDRLAYLPRDFLYLLIPSGLFFRRQIAA